MQPCPSGGRFSPLRNATASPTCPIRMPPCWPSKGSSPHPCRASRVPGILVLETRDSRIQEYSSRKMQEFGSLLKRNLHLGKAARRRPVHCRNNLRHIGMDECPTALSEYDNRNLAARKVLLITEILVGRHQHFKPRGLSPVQKFPVSQFFPPPRPRFRDRVAIDQMAGKVRGVPLSKRTSI